MRLIILLLLFTVHDARADIYASASAASFEVLIDNHLGGSGVVIESEGIGLVAAHTVMGNRRTEIRSRRFGRHDVQVIALDAGHDIALIRLPNRKGGYPFLTVAQDAPRAGDRIFLFGAPLYRHEIMLQGMVARNQPAFEYLPEKGYYIQVTHVSGPAPPGSSGGAWMNQKGEVVGVQSGLMHEDGSPVGIAYMAPHDAVKELSSTRKGRLTTTLGVGFEEIWEQSAAYTHRYPQRQEGLVAAKVDENGPGYLAGLRVGDLVIGADEQPVVYRDDLLGRIRKKRPGEGVKLILRAIDGTERILAVPLGSLEKSKYSIR
jgi:S1-C subfamily serine protease